MALISLEQAATRIGVPLETIEQWGRQGLLDIHSVVQSAAIPPGLNTEEFADEGRCTPTPACVIAFDLYLLCTLDRLWALPFRNRRLYSREIRVRIAP